MTRMIRRLSSLSSVAIRRSRYPTRHASLSTSSCHDDSPTHDVLIVGGGVVGSTLAKLLNERLPRLSVGLIERGPSPVASDTTKTNSPSSDQHVLPHPRSYALSPKSLNLLGPSVMSQLAQGPYNTMQVWEQDSPSLLLFTEADLDDSDILGAIVEDAPLVKALWGAFTNHTTCYTHTQVDTIQIMAANNNTVQVTTKQSSTTGTNSQSTTNNDDDTSSTTLLSSRILVAADGANSFIRQHMGIPFEGLDYNRTALTCTVELQRPMPPRAFQRFLTHGPVALLPTFSKHHATIVWSTTPEEANDYKEGNCDRLVNQLNELLQRGPDRVPPLFSDNVPNDGILSNLAYGVDKVVETLQYGLTMAHWNDYDQTFQAPPRISNIVGPRLTFPLSCRQAKSYTLDNKIVLVGDAAHTTHPMAGQGLNLGLADVGALVECLDQAYVSGMDLSTFFSNYESQQRFQNTIKLQGIHALHEMFGNRSSLMLHGKSLCMHAVNHVGPIRKQLAAIAAGIN